MTIPSSAPTTTNQANSALADLTPEQQRELLARLLREKAERAKTYPMSAGQQGLWHAFRRAPEATSFNVFLPSRIRSRIDLAAFRRAIDLVAMRHSSLRATFSDAGGKLTQRIHDDLRPEFSVIDLPGTDEEAVRRIVAGETLRPFDLQSGPLLRIVIYKLADDDWIILALTHHIVVDFWSLVLILNELRQAYQSFADGREPRLEPAPNNYSQFVQEQKSLLDGPRGSQMRAYWQKTIEGASPVVELPSDRIRPAGFSGRAANASIEFPPSLVPRISRFAGQNKATSFAVVQSALQVLISRYCNQKSFLIGSPFSGRSHRKFESTVGFFINMLPLKADLESNPTFSELVGRTSANLMNALENEAYPISDIVHDANIPRDPSRSPLFQVSCTFEKAQLREEAGRAGFLFPSEHQVWEFGGLRQESFYVPHQTCHYDLEFIFEQTATSLSGVLCYCRDLIDADTAGQITKNFPLLLDSLLEYGGIPVSQVPWNRSRPKRASENSAIKPERAAFAGTTVSALLESSAGAHRSVVAMQQDGQSVTYAQVWEQSGRIAAGLTRQGVGPGSLVPVCGGRGPKTLTAMLGVHRSGAAIVPIDLDGPAMDCPTLLADTNASLILTDQPHAWLAESAEVLLIDDLVQSAPATQTTWRGPSPEDLAYVVYTSGSTGKPKGVMVDHSAVSNTLTWRMRDVSLNSDDRVLMLLSHQFDAGLGIAWTTLTQGATLIWADDQAGSDSEHLVEQIIRDNVTVLPAVPSLLRILVAHPRFVQCESLRSIWTGGEVVPPELPGQIRESSRAVFWNFYGPTEAAIEATACQIREHPSSRAVPIGKPIANTQVLILDEHQRPVPDTVPGEIAVAGAGLARGYLNQPELTQQKFIPNPSDPSGKSRVYLTGDRGRRRMSGEIEFFGRTDHQVKLRGYRIELGEIESVIESHPMVERAAVKLVDAGSPGARMLAFAKLDPLIASSTEPAARRAAAIRRYASEQLPAYKLPAALMIVDHMPLTTSGKVDRRRLPDSVPSELLERQIVAPSTPLEEALARAWCEMLDVDEISVTENFFDAGGSSLQAAMLTAQLSDDLGVHVPTALLFDLSDISGMALRLVQLHEAEMTQRFGAECVRAQLDNSAVGNRSAGDAMLWGSGHPLIAPLKPSGLRRPIFMVHPPGGIVVCYRELARHLAGDQPLFGIRSRGLHGQEQLPGSVEQMAAEYVSAMKTVQPSGPYCVGGWSLGGLVAYEMAQQLLASGQQVAQLTLLDTTIPEGASDLVPVSEQVNVGLEYGIELTLDELGELEPENQLPFLWEHAKHLGVLDDGAPAEVVSHVLSDLQSLFHHHVELSRAYHLKPFAGHITLLRPADVPFELQVSDDRGWRHLAQQVHVHFVPGHHHSMVQPPHVQALAAQIQKSMR